MQNLTTSKTRWNKTNVLPQPTCSVQYIKPMSINRFLVQPTIHLFKTPLKKMWSLTRKLKLEQKLRSRMEERSKNQEKGNGKKQLTLEVAGRHVWRSRNGEAGAQVRLDKHCRLRVRATHWFSPPPHELRRQWVEGGNVKNEKWKKTLFLSLCRSSGVLK